MASSTSVSGDPSLQKVESPWYAAYPAPKHTDPASIHQTELLQWFHDWQKPGLDFVIVDLRRMDYNVCSSQRPLQTRSLLIN